MSLRFSLLPRGAPAIILALGFLLGCGVQTRDLRTPPSQNEPQTDPRDRDGADAQKQKNQTPEENSEASRGKSDGGESSSENEGSQSSGKQGGDPDGQQLNLQWSGTSFHGTDKLAIIATE